MHYRVDEYRTLTAGDIRQAQSGDTVTVYRSAVHRSDWAPMSNAIMAAFTRGANVTLVDDIESKELA